METRKKRSRLLVVRLEPDLMRRYVEAKSEKQLRETRVFTDSYFIRELMRLGLARLEKRYGLITPKQYESSDNS